MPTILCEKFGGEFLGRRGVKPLRNKAGQFAGRNSLKNSLRKSRAILLKFTRPDNKVQPKSALQSPGIKNIEETP